MSIDAANDDRLATDGAVEVAWPPEWRSGPRSLKTLVQLCRCHYRGIAARDDGSCALLFVYVENNYEAYFTTGYFPTLRGAVAFSRDVFQAHDAEEIKMNIFKSDKLFPNIRGVMLKEKRVTLTMDGRAKVTEMANGDARVEIFFSDHGKSAVVNRTQAMVIADVYGPETDDWKGKPVALYGELGTWFGKETWGLRVDKKASERAWKEAQRQARSNGAPKAEPADEKETAIAEAADAAKKSLFPDEEE